MDLYGLVAQRLPNSKIFPMKVFSGVIVSVQEIVLSEMNIANKYQVGEGEKFRHAGFSASEVGKIIAAGLYCGRETSKSKTS